MKTFSWYPALLAALLVAGTLSSPAWAQVHGLAVVRGTVVDTSGALVPLAEVALRNQNTGVSLRSQTSSGGVFNFGAVLPGNYMLTAEKAGFARWSTTFVVLTGQTVTVNPQLKVGSTTTTVSVVAGASPINTTNATVSDVKTAHLIHELPLSERSVTGLFNLTPGVEGGSNPQVNGAMVGATQILQDGMSVMDRFGGGISRIQPGLDSISEFSVDTSGADARYVQPSTIILNTKSGTNAIHGDLFESYQGSGGGLGPTFLFGSGYAGLGFPLRGHFCDPSECFTWSGHAQSTRNWHSCERLVQNRGGCAPRRVGRRVNGAFTSPFLAPQTG